MRLSVEMKRGWQMVGRQTRKRFCDGDSKRPKAVCALGAAQYAVTGDADVYVPEFRDARNAYFLTYGKTISAANDSGVDVDTIIKQLGAIRE